MDSRAEKLFAEAVAAIRSLARAERAASLRREPYKRFDSRGVHVLSCEIGRAQVLVDLYPEELGDLNAERLIAEARDEADEKWRRSYAVGVLVDAAAGSSDLAPLARTPKED